MGFQEISGDSFSNASYRFKGVSGCFRGVSGYSKGFHEYFRVFSGGLWSGLGISEAF